MSPSFENLEIKIIFASTCTIFAIANFARSNGPFRKHITHAMHKNVVAEMPWVLENTGSFIFKKIENTVYARFTEELLQLIFKII